MTTTRESIQTLKSNFGLSSPQGLHGLRWLLQAKRKFFPDEDNTAPICPRLNPVVTG